MRGAAGWINQGRAGGMVCFNGVLMGGFYMFYGVFAVFYGVSMMVLEVSGFS